MCKVISLFNHKGGVSKTTTTFNLGWAMADLGFNTLIVDADPQCNLTGTVLGCSEIGDLENFYDEKPNRDLYHCIEAIIEGKTTEFEPPNIAKTGNANLFLLAGHINLGATEGTLGVALKTSKALPVIQNLPGLLNTVIRKTATQNAIDLVLVDMSPSIGALNQCVLMGSDFFIIPTSPDYYCDQAMWSLSKTLPEWNKEIEPFKETALQRSFPKNPPKFIGTISQNYRPRNSAPASAYQAWIDKIQKTTVDLLIPALNSVGMAITRADFQTSCPKGIPYNLASIPDFNSLIALSQKNKTPIFALSEKQIGHTGIVLQKMEASRDNFRGQFTRLAKDVSKLVGLK